MTTKKKKKKKKKEKEKKDNLKNVSVIAWAICRKTNLSKSVRAKKAAKFQARKAFCLVFSIFLTRTIVSVFT